MSTWMKDKQMAAHFHVSVKTITRWAKRGMPRVREGSVVLYAVEDCEAWLRTRAHPSRASDRIPTSPTRRLGRPRRIPDV